MRFKAPIQGLNHYRLHCSASLTMALHCLCAQWPRRFGSLRRPSSKLSVQGESETEVSISSPSCRSTTALCFPCEWIWSLYCQPLKYSLQPSILQQYQQICLTGATQPQRFRAGQHCSASRPPPASPMRLRLSRPHESSELKPLQAAMRKQTAEEGMHALISCEGCLQAADGHNVPPALLQSWLAAQGHGRAAAALMVESDGATHACVHAGYCNWRQDDIHEWH